MSEIWLEIAAIFLANAGLIFWFRSESRADWRHMDAKMDSFANSIREDIKDFHARLCIIEEKNKSNKT